MFQSGNNLVDFARNRPIQAFDLCACLQIDDAMTEQVERLLPNLLRIVPGFQHSGLIQLIPNLVQFTNQLMVGLAHLEILIHFRQSRRFQHFENQNRMMGSQRTAALGNDVRMRNAILIAGIDQRRNRVVDIFLNRIVDAALSLFDERVPS